MINITARTTATTTTTTTTDISAVIVGASLRVPDEGDVGAMVGESKCIHKLLNARRTQFTVNIIIPLVVMMHASSVILVLTGRISLMVALS